MAEIQLGLPTKMNRGPSQEYLLQGSILDDSVDILLHRLKSMSDNSEEGLVKFKQHEIVYQMGSVSMRARKRLDAPDEPWSLCYLGNPESGVRTCVEVNCSSNVREFLQTLGFEYEFEFITEGWLFRKNRLKATVSKICTDRAKPMTSSHLVEVSLVSSNSSQAATEVQSFAEGLRPLVSLASTRSMQYNAH